PGVCGDNRKNRSAEECDGSADDACPGQCGEALGYFPCLCQTHSICIAGANQNATCTNDTECPGSSCIPIRRTRVVDHASSDLDNGWSGQSHDSGIVEGGGYVTDLWDCDGPSGPDFECVVGPTCLLPPNQVCNPDRNATGSAANADSICTGAGNLCRK